MLESTIMTRSVLDDKPVGGSRAVISRPKAPWELVLAQAIRNPEELCRLLDLDPSVGSDARPAAGGFPLLVPRPYLARIRQGDPDDPLLRQILPRTAETEIVPGYEADPLGEAASLCGPGLLRKYQGRVLMVATRSCGIHCRFCFRRHFSYPPQSSNVSPDCSGAALGDVENVIKNVVADPSIHEVILSGGDPLTVPDQELAQFAERLAEIPHLRRLRIHSRLPIVIPERVTEELIAWMRGVRLATILVIHVNHPAEIDAAVASALGRLIDAGIPVLSQSVLLRGVNDRVETLAEMFEQLADLRVMPYYLHQLDAVAGAAHFEVPTAVGVELIAQLRARLPGYIVPRYVRETRGGLYKEVLV